MAEKTYNELLINWLKSAYSMETRLVNTLENQAERASVFPELQSRLYGHREESQRHADMVKGCIERLGGDVSQIRTGVSKFLGEAQSKLLGAYGDSIVRDLIVASMVEQSEISSYRAIIALAENLDDTETVQTCQQILDEEEAMHSYLGDHLTDLVDQAYQQDLLVG